MGFEDQVATWFVQLAYQPTLVYTLIIALMFASSFGLPLPEEVTIVSSSIAAYMATHPTKYPPPYPDAVGINPFTLALVCLFAVFVSDYFIYWLGAFISQRLAKYPQWKTRFKSKPFLKVKKWIHEYGILAPCIFRFTPGLRFPGHMMCGVIGLPRWRFILVVGLAAMVTVPTQVLLISAYGEVILSALATLKIYALSIALFLSLCYIVYRWTRKKKIASNA